MRQSTEDLGLKMYREPTNQLCWKFYQKEMRKERE